MRMSIYKIRDVPRVKLGEAGFETRSGTSDAVQFNSSTVSLFRVLHCSPGDARYNSMLQTVQATGFS